MQMDESALQGFTFDIFCVIIYEVGLYTSIIEASLVNRLEEKSYIKERRFVPWNAESS